MSASMIGRTLGRYEITGEIGRGGMGVVYRATQTSLNRTVAVKMLPLAFTQTPEFLGRFRREAETLARLSHENVVHVYDVEELDGTPFIVMELVSGPSLAALLRESSPLPFAVVRDIGMAIATGLGAAHRQGIIHRDIKPDNVLFTPSGTPKLTDFGIARVDDTRVETKTGSLLGTPHYIAPEQANGEHATERSDVYSLGIALYEMLTGSRPFQGRNAIEVYLKHIQEPVPDLRDALPDVPDPLAAVVHRCLEKDPAKRPADGTELARELERLDLGDPPGRALRTWFSARTGPGSPSTPAVPAPQPSLPRPEVPIYEGETVAISPDSPSGAPAADVRRGPESQSAQGSPLPTAARGVGSRVWTAAAVVAVLAVIAIALWARNAAQSPDPTDLASGADGKPGTEVVPPTPEGVEPAAEGTTNAAGVDSSSGRAISDAPTPNRSGIFILLNGYFSDFAELGPTEAIARHAVGRLDPGVGAAMAGLLGSAEVRSASTSGTVDIEWRPGPEARVRFRQETITIAPGGAESKQVWLQDWMVRPDGDEWRLTEGTVTRE
ncbi:MAG: protein kinase [Candidatus Eisenbacteria bacterium]|nr:protein kinase [Candidatus Eisenbacteria bacterium]